MGVRISEDWKRVLQGEFSQPYFTELTQFVREEYGAGKVFPRGGDIFRAFDMCPFDDIKVVIIGQDPYHGVGQADGLCFSVNDGVQKPPSLRNIFKEIESDIGTTEPESGNLTRWAGQGVLLLNAVLTVRAHNAASHGDKGWEQFTDAVVRTIAREREGVVYLLWGAYAQRKGSFLDTERNCVLKAPHPSPLAAYRGFFGCKHFSKANDYLKSIGKEPIVW